MTFSVVRQSLVGLGVAATTLAIHGSPLPAGDCASVLSACSSRASFSDMQFGLSKAPKSQATSMAHDQSYTVSTRGSLAKPLDPASAGLGSALVYEEGSDGEVGNFALAVNGGRMSVDVRETFMKVVYTFDF